MSNVTPAAGGIFDFVMTEINEFIQTAQETFGPAFNKQFAPEAIKTDDHDNTPSFPTPKFGR